jgi:hypothetical protein
MLISTSFNMYSDANGGDPDSTSPTLREYHRVLWSKPLPNGTCLDLVADREGTYLYHRSSLGEFVLSSDAITHSYKNHVRKAWLTRQIPEDVNELFSEGSTIGGYLIFPSNRIDGQHTINQARGVHPLIDDRFDLTLECIRRFYAGIVSPLTSVLDRYSNFFALFEDFRSYTSFFFLDDLLDEQGQTKFYLPFSDFAAPPGFTSVDDYLAYKKSVMQFLRCRNARIEEWVHIHSAGCHPDAE